MKNTNSSLWVCVSHAELSKQTEDRLQPKYELRKEVSDADTIECDIVLKTTQRQIHMPSYRLAYIHKYVHTHTRTEGLLKPESREW